MLAGGVTWSFQACSGAKIPNILATSLGGSGQGAGWDSLPQLDRANLAKANLVTLTIGGNDAGYVGLLVECGLFRCDTPAFRAERAARIDALKPQLERVYGAIAARAPRARILVLGYANPFPATPASNPAPRCGRSRASRT